jgi:cytochrome c oxidase accessory protein FixG
MWIGFSFLTGFAFVSYFYPARELIVDLIHFDLSPWALFWLGFFTWTTNINAGWLREQVCMYMCPYARFQSVMFDHDTLIVSYDPKRGEPRGARKRGEAKQGDAADQKGDCVDCQLCVQVCPTGIDIRNGLQYQCIGCALCIDACDSIMDKMNYPRGLISYTTEHELDGGKTNFLRPRLIGYALMLTMMVSLFIYNIATRQPIEIDIIRDRNALYTTTNEGYVENIYTLKIMNMDQQPHSYTVSVSGMDELTYIGENRIQIEPGEVGNLPLRLRIDPGLLEQQTSKVFFSAIADDNGELSATEEARFIGPTRR